MDNNRKRNKPDRFGELGKLSEEESDDSFLEMLRDDSFGDKNYVDPSIIQQKRPIVATVKHPAKKSKYQSAPTGNISDINFDDEFNAVEINKTKNCDESLENPDCANNISHNKEAIVSVNTITEDFSIDCDEIITEEKPDDTAIELHRKMDEILARLMAIEKAMIKNNHLVNVKGIDRKSIEKFQLFLKSNRLPIENIADMVIFEENLDDQNFRSDTVKTLVNFPGSDSAVVNGNQPKLLKQIINVIVERKFLSNFTWTGKSTKGQKKQSFQNSKNIVRLIYDIAFHHDDSYQYKHFVNHLVNKVLKYAYDTRHTKFDDQNSTLNLAQDPVPEKLGFGVSRYDHLIPIEAHKQPQSQVVSIPNQKSQHLHFARQSYAEPSLAGHSYLPSSYAGRSFVPPTHIVPTQDTFPRGKYLASLAQANKIRQTYC